MATWPPATHQDVTDVVTPLLSRVRGTVQRTTASIANGATDQGTVNLGNGATVYRVAVNKPSRVRLYTTTAKQSADISRAIGTDPTGDHGLLLDVVFTSSMLSLDLSPAAIVADLKATPDGLIPVTITNTDTTTGAVTATFTYLRNE